MNRLADAQAYEEYDIIIDPVGGPEFDRFLEKLAPNGRYVLCGGVAGFPTPDFGSILLGRFKGSVELNDLDLLTGPGQLPCALPEFLLPWFATCAPRPGCRARPSACRSSSEGLPYCPRPAL